MEPPLSAEEVLQLVKRVERLQREGDQAQGKMEQLLTIAAEFGCSSLEELRKLRKRKKKERDFLTEEHEKLKEEFPEQLLEED